MMTNFKQDHSCFSLFYTPLGDKMAFVLPTGTPAFTNPKLALFGPKFHPLYPLEVLLTTTKILGYR